MMFIDWLLPNGKTLRSDFATGAACFRAINVGATEAALSRSTAPGFEVGDTADSIEMT